MAACCEPRNKSGYQSWRSTTAACCLSVTRAAAPVSLRKQPGPVFLMASWKRRFTPKTMAWWIGATAKLTTAARTLPFTAPMLGWCSIHRYTGSLLTGWQLHEFWMASAFCEAGAPPLLVPNQNKREISDRPCSFKELLGSTVAQFGASWHLYDSLHFRDWG